MAGFEKYQRYLNKKKKQEAFINLISNGNEESNRASSDNDPTNIQNISNSTTEDFQNLKRECLDVRAKYKSLLKEKKETPCVRLEHPGERALFKDGPATLAPLPFNSLRTLPIFGLLGSQRTEEANVNVRWCSLTNAENIPRVAFVIVEGLGVTELAAMQELTKSSSKEKEIQDSSNSSNLKLKSSKRKRKSDNFPSNNGLDSVNSVGTEKSSIENRISKFESEFGVKRKNDEVSDTRFDERDISEGGVDPNLQLSTYCCPSLIQDLLKSSSKFPVCLEIESLLEYSSNILEDVFRFFLSNASKKRLLEQYESMGIATQITGLKKVIKHNAPKIPVIKRVKPDKMNRMDLLLSVQEQLDFGYVIPSLSKGRHKKFELLHEVVEKVTPSSPMFGIDCEMCHTHKGHELTRISVVNEKLEVLYSTFVKPKSTILNYLTEYSGVTEDNLKNLSTTLADVRGKLREILPKDAILVGQSFCEDLRVLKLYHPYIIDTGIIFNVSGSRRHFSSLKALTKLFLWKTIQSNLVRGHDPTEDAAASIELVQRKLQHNINFGDRIKGGMMSFDKNIHNQVLLEIAPKPHLEQTVENLFAINIFGHLAGARCSSILIGPRMDSFKTFIDSGGDFVQTFIAETLKTNFKVATTKYQDCKFLVCHCKMSSYTEVSEEKSMKELVELDEGLQDLHASLPKSSLVMVYFTGNTNSSKQKSNGVFLYDLIGQEKENFFKRKTLSII